MEVVLARPGRTERGEPMKLLVDAGSTGLHPVTCPSSWVRGPGTQGRPRGSDTETRLLFPLRQFFLQSAPTVYSIRLRYFEPNNVLFEEDIHHHELAGSSFRNLESSLVALSGRHNFDLSAEQITGLLVVFKA